MFQTIKLYLFGGIVTILISCGVWFTIHERHQAVIKIEARDRVITQDRIALAKASTALREASEALAQKKSDLIGETFEKTVASPVVDPPHVLCNRPAPARPGLPQASGNQSENTGAPVLRTEVTVDIGPPVVTVGRDADAQVNALLDQLQVLVDEMNGTKK